MTLIVTITDTTTSHSQCYHGDEADISKILTDNAYKIARVLISREKMEDVLSIKD